MKVYHSLENFKARNPVVTIGMFDGVHTGHQTILKQVFDAKEIINGESVVITFWPHPQVFFGRTENFKLITTLDEKLELLAQTGLDNCIILPFTKEFSEQSPQDYIYSILHKGIGAKKVIIGYDHRYGKKGEGDFTLMQQHGKTLGFDVDEISAFLLNNVAVSSTKIREALLQGDVSKANTLLSYEYSIQGKVIEGKKIGRTIGIPTANIIPDSEFKIIPGLGIYVAKVLLNNTLYNAVVSIGLNPTIDAYNTKPSIEVHILDFNSDIYDETLRVYFIERIRSEQKYESLELLQAAIQSDIRYALEVLQA